MHWFEIALLAYGGLAWALWCAASIVLIVKDREDLWPASGKGALFGILWPLWVLWLPIVAVGLILRRIEMGGEE